MIGKLIGGEFAFYGFLLLIAWSCLAVTVAYECGKKGHGNRRKAVYGYLASILLFFVLLSGFFRFCDSWYITPRPPKAEKQE